MNTIIQADVPVLLILAEEGAAARLPKLLDEFSKLMLRDHLIRVQMEVRQGSVEIIISFTNINVWVSIPAALAVGSGLWWLMKKIRRRKDVKIVGKSDQAAYSQAVHHLKERVHALEPYQLITQRVVKNSGFYYEIKDHGDSLHPYYVTVSCEITYGAGATDAAAAVPA